MRSNSSLTLASGLRIATQAAHQLDEERITTFGFLQHAPLGLVSSAQAPTRAPECACPNPATSPASAPRSLPRPRLCSMQLPRRSPVPPAAGHPDIDLKIFSPASNANGTVASTPSTRTRGTLRSRPRCVVGALEDQLTDQLREIRMPGRERQDALNRVLIKLQCAIALRMKINSRALSSLNTDTRT